MKYKVGDKVRIKSKDWWDAQPKDEVGDVKCNKVWFTQCMSSYCGKVATISIINSVTYELNEFPYHWTDEMFDDSYNTEKPIITEEMIKDIAEVIKKHNLGVCVSENECKLIIEPLNTVDELPIDTPCMCSYNGEQWELYYYFMCKRVYDSHKKSKDATSDIPFEYIIPFDKFNPNNIEESLKYNIVK